MNTGVPCALKTKNLCQHAKCRAPCMYVHALALKRTPGISPTAWPERPKPAISTSSCAITRHVEASAKSRVQCKLGRGGH
eukprot:356968-Chlamydomonas_euryale.AAC.18